MKKFKFLKFIGFSAQDFINNCYKITVDTVQYKIVGRERCKNVMEEQEEEEEEQPGLTQWSLSPPIRTLRLFFMNYTKISFQAFNIFLESFCWEIFNIAL